MSKKEMKIYKIRDCRKYYDRAAVAYLGFAGSWLVSLFTASNYDQFIALLAGVTCSVLKTKYELNMLHSYEVNRIKEIYKDILKKYIKLNGDFNFKDPLEVFTLFAYAIRNDVLSIKNERELVFSKRFDSYLIRELTLNNHGVCRHTSTMLADVFKEMNIQSEVGVCIRPQIQQVMKPIDESDRELVEKMMEDIKKFTQIEINGESVSFDDMMICPPQKIVYEEIPLTKSEKSNGNHAITLATDEEYTYYLDALNSCVYTKQDNEDEYISNEGLEIKMMPVQSMIINERYKVETGKLKQSAPMEYMIEQLSKHETTISDNEDLIDKFQKDIKDELEEAEEMHRLILK